MQKPFIEGIEAYNETCHRVSAVYVDHRTEQIRFVTSVYTKTQLLFSRTTECSFLEFWCSIGNHEVCPTEPNASLLSIETPPRRKRARERGKESFRIPTEWIEKIENELQLFVVATEEAA